MIQRISQLRDKHNTKKMKRTNSIYIVIFFFMIACHPDRNAETSCTTIVPSFQNKIDPLLAATLIEHKAVFGKVLIMETSTGYTKAMVGLERKDTTNLFQPATDFCIPLPTELRQVATVLAALETGKVSYSDTIDVGDGIYITEDDTIKGAPVMSACKRNILAAELLKKIVKRL